jgi:pimeloyl-ACP methyl ester carboxylesterase
MSTFVLVHGAWHGAWCWELLIPELEARGHNAVAVDLPSRSTRAGSSRYARTVVRAIRNVDEPVTVVGHSLGGLTIPLVGAERPVERLIFVCALLPVPGASVVEQEEVEPDLFCPGFGDDLRRDRIGRSHWPEPLKSIPWLFGKCQPGPAAAAAGRLGPQGRRPSEERWPLPALPAIPVSYVLGREDRAINPEWSRRAATERLGVAPIELDSDHSPFLSAPGELAAVLDELA